MVGNLKQKRSRNFTDWEKNLLFNIVKTKYFKIIENKSTDGPSVLKKNKAWEEVSQQYNRQAQTGPRTAKQLHALYDFLRKNARRNRYNDKNQLYKIGSTTFIPKSGVLDEEIVTTLKPQFEPLCNILDTSATYLQAVASTSTGHRIDTSEMPQCTTDTLVTPETISVQTNDDTSNNNESNAEEIIIFEAEEVPKASCKSPFSKKKQQIIDLLANRFAKRKNAKDQKDDDVGQIKKRVYLLEEEIKQKQLEGIMQQNANSKTLFEIDLQVRLKQLEAVEKEILYKDSLISKSSREDNRTSRPGGEGL